MNRWGFRILGLLLILMFLLVFANLYKTLVQLQRQHAPATTTTSTSSPR